MKTYTGMMVDGQKVVYVRYPGGAKVVMPKHLKHSKEDKFDWGQNSGESLNTALSLLMNAFATEFCDKVDCTCYNDWVMDAYQTFDAEFVAKLDKNYWKINQAAVCDWAFDFLRNKKTQKVEELVTTS